MPRPLVAIIGCGWIARRHAAAARRLRADLDVAFASRDLGRARAYAREFGGAAAFGTYEEALRDPRVSAAIVCTPHDRHLADTLQALALGRHVLVEKPIARTLDEADRMIDGARRAGRVLMVAENFRFMPAFRRVAEIIASGGLGRLRELHLVARGFRRHAGWRLAAASMGGGVLIDGGIHYVHNLRRWGGEVRRVFGLAPPHMFPEMSGEDGVDALLEMEGGVIGFLSNSVGTPGMTGLQWSTVSGTRGSCVADNRGRFVIVRGLGGLRTRVFWRDQRGYVAMLEAFVRAMTTGEPPETGGAEGRRDLAVVLAVYRSIAEGRPVEVEC
jgi:predicted dehydrogenase